MKSPNIISLVCIAAISLAALAGCEEPANGISAKNSAEMVGSSVPQTQPADKDVMATVDGEPIYMDALHELLVESNGMATAQQLIANKLVDQQAAQADIGVTDADIETRIQSALDSMLPESSGREQQERVLESMLAQRGLSRSLWLLSMRRNAILAKIAAPQVKITDELLEAAFANEYGRAVQVRHIQVATPTEAQEVLAELEKGADFSELARRLSKNPASARNGGLLPWVTAKTPRIPPVLATAAMALTEVGEIPDPIQMGTAFHVLKLDQVRQAQDIALESVRDELTAKVQEEQIVQIADLMLRDLLESAQMSGKIRLVNPILKAQKK